MSVPIPTQLKTILRSFGLMKAGPPLEEPPAGLPLFDCSTVVWQPNSHLICAAHREAGPIHYDPSFKAFVIVRHADVTEALKDAESLDKSYSRGFDAYLNSGVPSERKTSQRCMKSALVFDQEKVTALVDDWMNGFLSGSRTFDAVAQLGVPLPRAFISDLLGLNGKDVQRLLDRSSPNRTDIGSSMGAVEGSIYEILEDIRKAPRDGVFSGLVHAQPENRISDHQIVIMVRHIWFAGTVTFSASLPAALLWLCRRPDLADELRRAPGKIPNFFSEVLRLESPTQFVPRGLHHGSGVPGKDGAERKPDKALPGYRQPRPQCIPRPEYH
jgi:cytochrome P450